MKLILLGLFFTIVVNAQWVQTSLGSGQYGYNIYSNGFELYAATLNGVYKTTDTGNPWINIGLQNRLVFDVITSGQFVLAATEGNGPGVFRTSDNGTTWLEANGLTNQSVRAFTKNSSYIFVCTWGGGVFRSSDNGANWESLGLTNEGFRSIYSAGEKIFAGGYKIYSSTDNGSSWIERQLPYPGGDTWNFYYYDGILYACDSGLYESIDLGNTWHLKYGVTYDTLGNAIDSKIFKDLTGYQNTLIASVAFNSIMISNDGGTTWNSFNEGLFNDWTFAGIAIKEPYIWALRDFMANAYMRPLSEVTSIEYEDLKIVAGHLLQQNYPNPFNPQTKISWQSPVASHQTLKVYDVLGNEVASLINEFKNAGSYEVDFNASKFSSGIYFYQLKAGDFVETKKMILMK